ncbi:MAG: ribulose-phosphate 3-epimerase [Anaerolineales bacterium]|nr:MAG: ribulose-phosphate 3-epimerase [Anaerolineales bacterium]
MRSGLPDLVHISASLLAADFACLGEEVRRAEQAGVDSFHFDMMDGHYVPNLAFAPAHLEALRPYAQLPFHTHLELDNPDHVLSKFNPVQADVIIVQWNTLPDPPRTFARIRSQNIKVGLGLNLDDPLDEVQRFLRDIDLLLLLGVHPGFGGQAMRPGMQEKIDAARRLTDRLDPRIPIAVDGGVKPENAAGLVEAGADCLIMGTALFHSPDMAATIGSIRASISQSPRR